MRTKRAPRYVSNRVQKVALHSSFVDLCLDAIVADENEDRHCFDVFNHKFLELFERSSSTPSINIGRSHGCTVSTVAFDAAGCKTTCRCTKLRIERLRCLTFDIMIRTLSKSVGHSYEATHERRLPSASGSTDILMCSIGCCLGIYRLPRFLCYRLLSAYVQSQHQSAKYHTLPGSRVARPMRGKLAWQA